MLTSQVLGPYPSNIVLVNKIFIAIKKVVDFGPQEFVEVFVVCFELLHFRTDLVKMLIP